MTRWIIIVARKRCHCREIIRDGVSNLNGRRKSFWKGREWKERQEKRNSRKRKSGAAAYKALHDIVTAPGLLKDLKQMTLYKHTGIYATHDAF